MSIISVQRYRKYIAIRDFNSKLLLLVLVVFLRCLGHVEAVKANDICSQSIILAGHCQSHRWILKMLGRKVTPMMPTKKNAIYKPSIRGQNNHNVQVDSTPNIRSVFLRNNFSASPGSWAQRSKHHSVNGLISTPVKRVCGQSVA